MGFDRNDPNVTVTITPLSNLSELGNILNGKGGYTDDSAPSYPAGGDQVDPFADIRNSGSGGYRPGNVEPAPSLRDIKAFERACEDKALFGDDTAKGNSFDGDDKLSAACKAEPQETLERIMALADKGAVVTQAARDVIKEVARASVLHGDMKSGHEGYAVLLEEVDELWDLVKTDKVKSPEGRKEAIQIAAMAIRFIVDVIENDSVSR